MKQRDSNNLLWINAHKFVKMAQDVKGCTKFQPVLSYVFGKPGWAPNAVDSGNDKLSEGPSHQTAY